MMKRQLKQYHTVTAVDAVKLLFVDQETATC